MQDMVQTLSGQAGYCNWGACSEFGRNNIRFSGSRRASDLYDWGIQSVPQSNNYARALSVENRYMQQAVAMQTIGILIMYLAKRRLSRTI
jgi:hypothetical protein